MPSLERVVYPYDASFRDRAEPTKPLPNPATMATNNRAMTDPHAAGCVLKFQKPGAVKLPIAAMEIAPKKKTALAVVTRCQDRAEIPFNCEFSTPRNLILSGIT
jgi:hypothetical protein